VRRALLSARSIAYSDPKPAPSGVHLERVLGQLGIADAVRPKTTLRTPFDGGVELIAKGEVELGMYLITEIRAVEGVTLVGPLPGELQSYVVYAGAVSMGASSHDAGKMFLAYISGLAARVHWQAAGFEPASGGN